MKTKSLIHSLIFFALLMSARGAGTEKEGVGLYGQRIILETDVVGPARGPSEAGSKDPLRDAADDLAAYLGQATGKTFEIESAPAVIPASAIVLTLSSSLDAPADAVAQLAEKGREPFVIRGDASKLQIIANDHLGLSHGVSFYLEQLGFRWLLPGANWTIVPKLDDVTLTINQLVEPAYKVRSFASTGGYYSNLWGRAYDGENGGVVSKFEIDEVAWKRRLRYGGEYQVGGHTGEAFISDKTITPILEAHPEYLAKIDGVHTPLYLPVGDLNKGKKEGDYVLSPETGQYVLADPPGTGTHSLNIIAKLNVGNPDLVKLYVDWTMKRFRAARERPDKAFHNMISVEPADGVNYGNNFDELPGDGSDSDQAFYLINECAKAVSAEFPGARVSCYAYATHAAPPSFPLEPNVLVSIIPYGFNYSGLQPDEFIAVWKEKTGGHLSLYDYWSIPDWNHDEPTFNYLERAGKSLRMWHANGVESFNAESTNSAGAMGLAHYVAAHLMWDLDLDEHALIEDWYDKAFGPAKVPMKRMLERWARSFKLLSPELGDSYQDISEAMDLAKGDAAVTARVDDYARYLHYLRVRLEATPAGQDKKVDEVSEAVAYILSINDSRMVATIRAFDLYAFRGYPELKDEFHIHNPKIENDPEDGPGWANVHPLSHDDVVALVVDGAKTYPPADFVQKTYTGNLAPLHAPLAWTPPTGDPWGTIMPTAGDLDADVMIPEGLTKLPLRVTRLVDNTMTLKNAAGETVFTHEVTKETADEEAGGEPIWDEMDIPVTPGNYKLHFHPIGGRATGKFQFQTWRGVPLTLGLFLSPKAAGKSPQLYFYVPPGLEKVVLYYPSSALAGGPLPHIFDSQGDEMEIDLRDSSKLLVVTVPQGEDGKVWSLKDSISPDFPMEMLASPQAFSFTPEVVMVPEEVEQN